MMAPGDKAREVWKIESHITGIGINYYEEIKWIQDMQWIENIRNKSG